MLCRISRLAPLPLRPHLLLILLAGCGAGSDRGGPEGLDPWIGVVDTRFGTVDGDLVFGTVTAIREGPDGLVYTQEFERADLQVFSPEGDRVRVIGRGGDGPGELRRPASFGWTEDRLWVWDAQLRRLSWFDLDGTFLTSVQPRPVQLREGEPPFGPSTPLPGGTFLATQVIPSRLIASGEITRAPALRVTAEGEVLDTLYVRDVSTQTLEVTYGEGDSAGALYTSQPFHHAPTQSVSSDHPVTLSVEWSFAPEPLIRVTRRSFDGDTLSVEEVPFTPIQVTPAEVEAAVERIAEILAGGIGTVPLPEARRLARRAIVVPEHHRPVTSVIWTGGREVWLRLPVERNPDDEGDPPDPEPTRWIALHGDGDAPRLVELPPSFTPRWLGDGYAWGVLTDALGVNSVARVRLEPREN